MRFKVIQLVCGAGFSSSFMANKFRTACRNKGWDLEINASSDSEIDNVSDEIDLLLVGPHLFYMIDDLKKEANGKYEVALIPNEVYAHLDGEALADYIDTL